MVRRNDEEVVMSKLQQPSAAPPVVDRAAFDAALADQVRDEKELTRHGDRVSAARWRLPMVRVDDYAFDGPDGPVHLTELFGDRYLLLVQNVMYSADWDDACPSCTWAIDDLPADMGRLDDEGIAFAMVSEAPVEKLEQCRTQRGGRTGGCPPARRATTGTGGGPCTTTTGTARCRGTRTTCCATASRT